MSLPYKATFWAPSKFTLPYLIFNAGQWMTIGWGQFDLPLGGVYWADQEFWADGGSHRVWNLLFVFLLPIQYVLLNWLTYISRAGLVKIHLITSVHPRTPDNNHNTLLSSVWRSIMWVPWIQPWDVASNASLICLIVLWHETCHFGFFRPGSSQFSRCTWQFMVFYCHLLFQSYVVLRFSFLTIRSNWLSDTKDW